MEIRNSQSQQQPSLKQPIAQPQNEQGGMGAQLLAQNPGIAGLDSLSLSDTARQLAQASAQTETAKATPIVDQRQAQIVLGKIVSDLDKNPNARQAVYGNLNALNFKALLG